MDRIAPIIALPTYLVLSACFNPRAVEMMDDAGDETSAGTSDTADTSATSPGTHTTTGNETSGSTTPDSGPGPGDSEDGDCVDHDDCDDPRAPFCNAGTCVACGDTPDPDDACATRFPDAPLCDSGECVQCTADNVSACGDATPVCDVDNRTCMACTFHYQCPQSACDIAEGSCMPSDKVWTVDHTGAGDYLKLDDALTQIPSGQKGTIIMRDGHYFASLVIGGGRTVAIIRGTETPRLLPGTDPEPLFDLGNATVYLQGLWMAGDFSNETVYAAGTQLWIDECWFGTFEFSPVYTAFQARTGVRLRAGADLTMRNSIVGGFGVEGHVGLDIAGGSHATIVYSTIGARNSTLALTCSSPGNVLIRNSILAAQENPAYSCGAAEIVSTAVRPSVSNGWFANYTNGNLHLSASGAAQFANIATWLNGDPAFDFDGDPRSSIDGTPEHAGADVP